MDREGAIHRSEQLPTSVDHAVKKQGVDGSTEFLFDRLPESILHDILSRLSIFYLLIARRTCVAWHRIVSSCEIFQRLYDEKNKESWIALRNPLLENNCLFDINSRRWRLLQVPSEAWFLERVADGLMLFVSREGKMGVANPLTGQHRLLPDAWVTSHLRLGLSVKRKLSTRPQLNLSLNIVIDPADQKTFKVIVWGELRTRQVHLLVYTSATDTWTTKLCPEVDYKHFRRPFHSTVHGNIIYFISEYWSVLANYNTETDLFIVQRSVWPLHQWFLGMAMDLVETLGIFAYRSQILLIGVILGRQVDVWHPFVFVGLWQLNPTDGQWKLFSVRSLEFSSLEVVAAYDGEDGVTVIPSMGSVLMLNLDTKVWTITSSGPTIGVIGPACAFHMKLKFCTAL